MGQLEELCTAQASLQQELARLKLWLAGLETESGPQYNSLQLVEYKDNLSKLCQQERELGQASQQVSSLLTRAELLLEECDVTTSSPGLAALQADICSIEQRWQQLCLTTGQRKAGLEECWEQWQLLQEQAATLTAWLDTNLPLARLDTSSLPLAECSGRQHQLDTLLAETRTTTQDSVAGFNALYCLVARAGRLDRAGQLRDLQTGLNTRWGELTSHAAATRQALQHKLDKVKGWRAGAEQALLTLRQTDAEVTEAEYGEWSEVDQLARLRELQARLVGRRTELVRLADTGPVLELVGNSQDREEVETTSREVVQLLGEVETRLARLLGGQRAAVTSQTGREPGITSQKTPEPGLATQTSRSQASLETQTSVEPNQTSLATQTSRDPSQTSLATQTSRDPSIIEFATQTSRDPSIIEFATQTSRDPSIIEFVTQTSRDPSQTSLATQTSRDPSMDSRQAANDSFNMSDKDQGEPRKINQNSQDPGLAGQEASQDPRQASLTGGQDPSQEGQVYEQDQAVQADTLQLGGLEDQLADMEVAGATDPATRSASNILPQLTQA